MSECHLSISPWDALLGVSLLYLAVSFVPNFTRLSFKFAQQGQPLQQHWGEREFLAGGVAFSRNKSLQRDQIRPDTAPRKLG